MSHKLLIRRDGAFGDVLLLTPILRRLKKQYADTEITVATRDCEEILRGNPWAVIVKEARNEDFDEVIDLNNAYETRQGIHILDAYEAVSGFGKSLDASGRLPEVPIPLEDWEWVRENFNFSYVILDYGLTWPSKTWPVAKYDELAKRILNETGIKVVTVGKNNYKSPVGTVDMIGKTTLGQLIALVGNARSVVCNDNVLVHIAQARYIPTVAIFGCTDPELIICNVNSAIVTLRDESLECIGCHHWLPVPRYYTECLLLKTPNLCMNNVSVNSVFDMWTSITGTVRRIKEKLVNDDDRAISETGKVKKYLDTRYFDGKGLDIACGKEKIVSHAIGIDYPIQYDIHSDHPTVADLQMSWEEAVTRFEKESLDFIFSSHLIEDYDDEYVRLAILIWTDLLKPGGRLVLVQPIEDLFKKHCEETGQVYNAAHKQNWKSVEDFLSRYPFKSWNLSLVESSKSVVGSYSFYVVFQKG